MANNTRKISELSSKGIVPESALLPVAVAGAEKETYRTTLNNLRANLLFENAYETLAEGIAATVKDEIFYVYTDDSQFYVAAFTNVNGASATALYKDNTPVIYGTGKMMADGKFGSYTSYVSYLYNNGSANGGETEIALPFDCFDVSEMFLNGGHQFKGLNYTFDRLSNKVKLKGALTAGAFVVFYVRPYPGTPVTPVEPGITDYVNVTWLYNDGAAVGGETSLTPPWTFSTVPAIYINGSKQVLNKHYEIDSTGLKINLSKALKANDVVEVLLGGSRSIITAQVSGTPAEVLLTLGQTTGATKVNTSYGVSLEQVVQGFYGVNSFDDLRNRRPNFEGEKVNLKGYYTGSTSGGGQFIGHIGTGTDDAGTIAAGNGFYWERMNVTGSSIDIYSFGAKDNSIADNVSFDNRAAIQKAVDYANNKYLTTGSIYSVFIPTGIFKVKSASFTPTGASSAAGIISIVLKSGVRIYGNGTIQAFENHYGTGAFYRVFGSDRGALIENASIEDITIDGQRDNQASSTQCSNIVLEAKNNILIKNVRSINANGNGMMVRGTVTDPVLNVKITNCVVDNCSMIGIQVSQFNGISIDANSVANTGNNGIDIYGDTDVSASASNGVNFSITSNTLRNIGIGGIFPETVANGTISGNSIYSCQEGIHLNRIKSVPRNISITGNTITKSTVGGIIVTGDHEGVNITGNTISDWTGSGFCFGTGSAGNVSNIFATSNMFLPTSAAVTIVSVYANIASRIEMNNNFIRNNVGVPATNFVTSTTTTSSGVNIGSWAVTASGTSTGTQMYRQGTFTPTVKGATTAGTYTYTTQSGSYVRIGNIVHFQAKVVWTAGTGTGQLRMTGLPFTPSAVIAQPQVNTFFSGLALTAYGQEIVSNLSTAVGELMVITQQQGSATTTNVAADSVTSATLSVRGFYFVD